MDWKNPPSLGLRLVTSLTEQLNGTIELDRTGGTCFTLYLSRRYPGWNNRRTSDGNRNTGIRGSEPIGEAIG
jgi:hypothetical protein